MKRFVFLLFVATTLVVSLPTEGAVTVTLILDASSPRPLGTSLVANGEDFFLVTAEGAVRVVTGFPISRGWFDPSGLGRLRRTGQVFSDMPYGSVIGTFGSTLGTGFYVGDIATWDTQPVDVGDEFRIGLNMSTADQNTMQGEFVVHVTQFTMQDIEAVTVRIDPNSPRPLGTGIVTGSTSDKFLVFCQGTTRTVAGFPLSEGWFDPSGLGRLRRTGQVFSDMPYGSVIGTFGSTLGLGFYVGDIATWDAQPVDVGDEFKVGLNMSVADQGGMDGFFQVHVVKIGNLVITAVGDPDFSELPGGDRIFLEQNAPNPFNPNTKIRFTLARPQRAKIFVSNLAGDHVALLEERSYDAGTHTVTWNGCDAVGREVASGTYIVRLEAEDGVQARKVMLVR